MSQAVPPRGEQLYGGSGSGRRVTVRDIAAAKARGEKWPMLTAYDALTAGIFDKAGIPVLLVGDSAAMVVYGHASTIPVTPINIAGTPVARSGPISMVKVL